MQWVRENWQWLIPLCIAVLSGVNRATVRFDELTGPWWRRILPATILLLVELASVLKSKGAMGLVKLPLTVGKMPSGKLPIIAIVCIGALGACGGWQKTTLRTTSTITSGVIAAHAGMAAACKPTIAECRKDGCRELACCPALVKCQDVRLDALKGLDVTMRTTMLVILAVNLSDKPSALAALTTALESWRAVLGALKDLGLNVDKWSI